MTTYYVTHPNLGFSATVEAPSTEKARTAFLDYLERQGKISRSRRQDLRRNMVADRIADPGEVMADVNLAYGYSEASAPRFVGHREFGGVEEVEAPFVPEEDISPPTEEVVEIPIERQEPGPPVFEEEELPPEPRIISPIQELSLGRRLER
ncbi:hypothetical protein LCGC14_0971250 [marine sediment metagenome]|uniref:Uncharacterized protein n=1 Tax=marine sediment metagenome TaxID=412755 RepID=A0A0F9NBR0_9ZZZZ